MATREPIDTPLAIVGNALAGLVCALERAKRGQPTLLVNPGGPWGGYFAGLQADGRRWDLGTVLYEFTSFRTPDEPPSLSSYDAERRNDVGRFTEVVKQWVGRHQPTRAIRPLEMWTGERWLPDLLLGNGLEALPQLGCAAAAREELAATLDERLRSPWHASRKSAWSERGATSFDTVSRINHGDVLHEAVFAPFARQVMDAGTDDIAALFHRIPWLPLLWPQTLLAALEGRPMALPPTIYSHPVGTCVAELCAALVRQLQAEPAVTLLSRRVVGIEALADGYALRFDGGDRIVAGELAWAQTPRQALEACGEPLAESVERRLPLMLALLRVPRSALQREFSVMHTIGSDTGLYRVSNVSGCAHEQGERDVRLAVEAHPQRFAACHGPIESEAAITTAVVRDLARLRLLREGASARLVHLLRLPGALPLPTPASMAAYADERDRLRRRMPALHLLAASAGAYATSLSDQIVQGLQLAEALRTRSRAAIPHPAYA